MAGQELAVVSKEISPITGARQKALPSGVNSFTRVNNVWVHPHSQPGELSSGTGTVARTGTEHLGSQFGQKALPSGATTFTKVNGVWVHPQSQATFPSSSPGPAGAIGPGQPYSGPGVNWKATKNPPFPPFPGPEKKVPNQNSSNVRIPKLQPSKYAGMLQKHLESATGNK